MKLSIDTELEEIAELRASIAIIEDAIKRRENAGEESSEEEQPLTQHMEQPSEEPEQTSHEEPQQEAPKTEAPSVDLSALATSDYGERVENRSMDTAPTPQPSAPQQDNKSIVKNIIQTLKDRNSGNPIQMQDIINLAKDKSINEEETRKLVNELQSSSSI
ncbi:MAG: hypothetical protein CMH64_03615 [Nanoarchaeota archaeon]|nr:hypothetical protein [Nanoarchaeota archaeon]|tara:strand:- start:227 stop:709 length:483 start_codon:yes stop_codon:yes gene_type:complete